MKATFETLWEDVLSALKPQMNDESYELWFKPIKPVSFETGNLVIQVPNPFFSDWMRDHYQSQIEKLLQERVGEQVRLAFQVVPRIDKLPPALPAPVVLTALTPPQPPSFR